MAPTTLKHRQLFLDDGPIERIEGLQRKIGQPIKYEHNPVIQHHQRPWQEFRAQVYGTVLYDQEARRFSMWYLAGPRFPGEEPINVNGRTRIPNLQLCGYAESTDGFQWELPTLGLVEFEGSRENNLCRISDENVEGIAVVRDPADPDPSRRYKAFYWEHDTPEQEGTDPASPINGMSVSFSADGKSWVDHPENPVIPMGSDTGQQALWDPVLGEFVAFGRFGSGGRKIARSTSDDFITWSNPQLVFEADEDDEPGMEIYGMGINLYEGVYVGLPWMWRRTTTDHIDVQLTTSRDGIRWTRVAARETFLPNGPKGSWDAGCLFTACQPIHVVGDTMYIFYSGLSTRHEGPRPNREEYPEFGEASTGVATLRRDGFVSLCAGIQPGTLTTRSFHWPRDRNLHLNVDAQGGRATIVVLNETGNPLPGPNHEISGNHTDLAIDELTPSADDSVRLQVTLQNAQLYSYWLE